ncbi:MAG: hypothetical protein IRZ31_19435 [Thermogemmatispora sp.]|uniref:hypothetical protein n=1 Tax=Thermogemmatispora sp. TaxID=1968838 RepID=UPI002610A02B|nr:hypothetical protein [Thermogemmatispora sp.]MBX5459072.1 hypothetical protein [Thermogemmatispora sp.]
MRNQPPEPDSAQPLTLLLALRADETEESDPALIHTIGRETVQALQAEGIPVQPMYTGQQGGDFLVQVVVPTVVHWVAAVWDHRAVITELLNDAVQLTTLAAFIYQVVQRVKRRYEQHVGEDESRARPLTISLEVEGDAHSLDASSPTHAQVVLTTLLKDHQASGPRAAATTPLELKLCLAIPRKRAPGKRRHGKPSRNATDRQ